MKGIVVRMAVVLAVLVGSTALGERRVLLAALRVDAAPHRRPGEVVWATYSGGAINFGTLRASADEAGIADP